MKKKHKKSDVGGGWRATYFSRNLSLRQHFRHRYFRSKWRATYANLYKPIDFFYILLIPLFMSTRISRNPGYKREKKRSERRKKRRRTKKKNECFVCGVAYGNTFSLSRRDFLAWQFFFRYALGMRKFTFFLRSYISWRFFKLV